MSGDDRTGQTDRRLRVFLLGLSALALASVLVELWLQDHNQDFLQLVPWGLCGAGLLALLAALLRPGRASLLLLRAVMSLLALGGLAGVGVHFKANLDFQQEIHPTAPALDYLPEALKGAAALLAPGSLIFAALVALAATYRHPALSRSEAGIAGVEAEAAEPESSRLQGRAKV